MILKAVEVVHCNRGRLSLSILKAVAFGNTLPHLFSPRFPQTAGGRHPPEPESALDAPSPWPRSKWEKDPGPKA